MNQLGHLLQHTTRCRPPYCFWLICKRPMWLKFALISIQMRQPSLSYQQEVKDHYYCSIFYKPLGWIRIAINRSIWWPLLATLIKPIALTAPVSAYWYSYVGYSAWALQDSWSSAAYYLLKGLLAGVPFLYCFSIFDNDEISSGCKMKSGWTSPPCWSAILICITRVTLFSKMFCCDRSASVVIAISNLQGKDNPDDAWNIFWLRMPPNAI